MSFYYYFVNIITVAVTSSMTAEREKCGLSSFLPMSCRGRAEAFARRLHSRLRSLGSHDENGPANESSWLAAHENPVAVSQPRHVESDMYLDFGLLESPGSPEEEIEDSELHRLMNQDNLKHSNSEECHCPKSKDIKGANSFKSAKPSSNDSDSDGSFYDTENDVEQRVLNYSSKSDDSETGIYVSSQEASNQEESFATTSECTPQPSSSLSEDLSTLSLRDSDCPSPETSGTFTEPDKCENEITDDIYVKCNGNVKEDDDDEKSSTNGKVDSNCQTEDTDINVNSLSVDKDLTMEYPSAAEESTEPQKVELRIDKNNDEDDFGGEERIPRVRRCSSLKTGKTPPNTPGRKKIVRFADALGLDLADVRTFLDEVPKVPVSAFDDLVDVDLIESSSDNNLLNTINSSHGIKPGKLLMPLFQQPGGHPNFLDLVRDNQVCLENAYVDDPITLSIRGTVRVRNLDFHKSVYMRYTLDSWKTFADVQAVYVENSCDGFSDKFSFLLYAHTLPIGQRLEFACRFQCKGCQYWDNNNGANYCFQCLPASHHAPINRITGIDDWGASFY
ncbi:hypothetical protein NQ318_012445 [Aromia moschata]|uniref:CBM21 domain-containing protein n=1 Tax=Aromia moschata TaxID=1265417 RepID=A0AAV8XXH0_9CUCU|nr:hypothetical protein NQ318_012445 [Aromia moschata]